MAEHQTVPAAWYPDRNVPNQLRWWDGRDWTADVRQLETVAVEMPADKLAPAEIRRGLQAVAHPAQGLGHATIDELRAWPAPARNTRSLGDVPVSEVPLDWAANEFADPARPYGDLSNWQPATPGSLPEAAAAASGALVEPVAAAADAVSSAASAQPHSRRHPQRRAARRLTAVPPFEQLMLAGTPSPQDVAGQVTEWPLAASEPALPHSSPSALPHLTAPALPHFTAAAPVAAPTAVHTSTALPQPAQQTVVALTRRQLRELVGGPLTTGAAAT